MKRKTFLATVAAATAVLGIFAAQNVAAQEKLRVGIIGQFSGPFASNGKAYQQGVELYMSTYGSRVGGREVEIIYKDIGGSNASAAKRLAEELIIRDKASILGGFSLTPEAVAAAPVLTETKTPAVVFNGAGLAVSESSPYIVRASNTQFQVGYVQAEWAIKKGYKRTYLVVSDFAAGVDLLTAFKKRYTALGGEIVGEDRIPLNTVDYAPYIERVARAKPALLNMFIPAGAPSVNATKALQAQGLAGKKDVAIISQAQLDEVYLPQYDDSIVGMYDILSYATDYNGAENRKYKDALKTKFGASEIPNYFGASAWDGMHIIYRMIQSQQGRAFDGTAALKSILGVKFDGAKGSLMIEPDTRNQTLDLYVRRAAKGPDGKLKLEISDVYKGVKSIP